MRATTLMLTALVAIAGCVGPGHHVRGGHRMGGGHHGGHRHHHRTGDVVDGILGILQGVIVVGELIGDISAASSPRRDLPLPPPPPPPPPPPEPVRELPAYFQGRIVWQGHPGGVRMLRLGLQPLGGGPLVATFETDVSGRFHFPAPLAGSYVVFVREPGYRGEVTFSTNGRNAFSLELPVAELPTPVFPAASGAGADAGTSRP